MSLLNTLKEQLSDEPLLSASHIVVAYSGGVDSHVLLHALHNIRQTQHFNFQLSAIHIHHGLSSNADQWQSHCQQVCAQLNIGYQTANVAVVALPRQSLEALAREARYNTLVELAPANSQILLGQHQDDQLETFLLQLKRGAGPKGLSAMNRAWESESPLQSDKKVGFYRPLLDVSQQTILNYAQQHKLQWCEDESNQNTDFERNFLRHDVLPVLHSRWPELARSVARSAALCQEQQSLLDEICAEKLQKIKASANSLALSELTKLTQPWVHQLVRYWLSELGIQSPSMAVLNQLMPEVLDAAEDATPILQWQGWQFRRFDNQLFVIKAEPAKVTFNKEWQQQKSIQLPNNQGELIFSPIVKRQGETQSGLIVDPSLGPIIIRTGGFSVRFKPVGSQYSKPIKQWFKQWKVAPWLRESALLVIQNEQVLGLLIEGVWHLGQSIKSNGADTRLWLATLEN
ncbi:tRNA lysidine(34) synthetase TilS [uncultured Paraglaciecola sp.]|uniref:tRNA lysidine(34) synthetase TilS n=1 Tax=uncultured Paraglaciecola sp. TaxID=1765024 RepID=UPI0030D983E1|tara:strand:+ start:87148 stop:88524 length:1377 start_codon:yes stop_codon:yes gene_type:complete